MAELGTWVASHVLEPGAAPLQSDGYYYRLWRQDGAGAWTIWRETFN